MNFRDRVHKAEQALPFAKVLSRHVDGGVHEVLAPGSDGRQYHVTLTPRPGQLVVDCRLGAPDGPICSGVVRGVCYHGLTAVLVAHGPTVTFSDMNGDWRRWRDDRRAVTVIDSAHGGRSVYLTPRTADDDGARAELPPGGIVIFSESETKAERAKRTLYGDD